MFRAYIIIPEGHPTLLAELEDTLRAAFRLNRLNGTAQWYYDEFVDPIEYGVRIDIRDISAEKWQQLLEYIQQNASRQYGEVRVEIP
jgi:hypothetical protein